MTVNVVPADLEERAAKIKACAQRIQDAVANVNAQIQKFPEGVFDGNRADQLRGDYRSAKAAMDNYEATLLAFAKLLNDAATAFREADKSRA